ncbi:MAG: hypothetical protein C0458_15850 [Methylobacterium sp.]|nr:hypothetical protein [Methylobacterium sp.]
MTLPTATLAIQIEEVRLAETRAHSLRHGLPVVEKRPRDVVARSAEVLNCARRSLETLSEHADEIRAFLKLPADAREAVLRHGETMGQMCLELAKREAIAKAGGPAR